MDALVNSISVKVTETLEIETIAPGTGVLINKRVSGSKSVGLMLSAPEFRKLHRAMAAAEPFICDAEETNV